MKNQKSMILSTNATEREPFKYRKSVERKVGKYSKSHKNYIKSFWFWQKRRTGHVIRKSQVAKDFDGLHNVNDYFDSASEKISLNTDDLESIGLSDIEIGIDFSS